MWKPCPDTVRRAKAHTASASGTPRIKTGINSGAKKKNVTPLAGGDFASVEPQDAVQFASAKGYLSGGGVRPMFAPALRAWIGFAEIHTAPPLS